MWITNKCHHDIMQPHLFCCCFINFRNDISSYFLQTIVHVIYFLQTIIHPIHFLYHSPLHSDLAYLVTLITSSFNLFVFSTFKLIFSLEINKLGVSLEKVWFYIIIHHLKLNSCLVLLSVLWLLMRCKITVFIVICCFYKIDLL